MLRGLIPQKNSHDMCSILHMFHGYIRSYGRTLLYIGGDFWEHLLTKAHSYEENY